MDNNKEMPMEPEVFVKKIIKCGRCMNCLDVTNIYCPQCGQKIDWSKIPDDVDVLFLHNQLLDRLLNHPI